MYNPQAVPFPSYPTLIYDWLYDSAEKMLIYAKFEN